MRLCFLFLFFFPAILVADNVEIVAASIESPQPVDGKKIVINIRIANRESTMVSDSTMLADLMINNRSVSGVERRWRNLQPNEERQARIIIQLPDEISMPEGIINIQWMGAETRPYVIPVWLVLRQPDLVPLNNHINAKGMLTFNIVNEGNATARATTTAVYVNGALRRRYITPELPPGSSRHHEFGGIKIEPGTQISIVADFNADIPESSEENNRLTFNAKAQ